jgi:hypothetical protein
MAQRPLMNNPSAREHPESAARESMRSNRIGQYAMYGCKPVTRIREGMVEQVDFWLHAGLYRNAKAAHCRALHGIFVPRLAKWGYPWRRMARLSLYKVKRRT